jgi:hypothetical protein
VHPGPGLGPISPAQSRGGMLRAGLAILVLAAVIAGGAILLRPAASPDGITPEQAAALQARVDQEQAQAQALRGQLAAADAELAVERAARRTLEDSLAALQTQAGQLRDRLAFYDQLFPAGPAGTVSIRALEISHIPAGLRYRVLLMRSARPGLAPFVGALRFIATGTRDGVQVRLPLAPLRASSLDSVAAGGSPPAAVVAEHAEAGAGGTQASNEASGKAEQAAEKAVEQAATPQAQRAASPVPDSPSDPVVPLEVDQYRSSTGILALPADFTPTEVGVEVVQDSAVIASQQAAVAF